MYNNQNIHNNSILYNVNISTLQYYQVNLFIQVYFSK